MLSVMDHDILDLLPETQALLVSEWRTVGGGWMGSFNAASPLEAALHWVESGPGVSSRAENYAFLLRILRQERAQIQRACSHDQVEPGTPCLYCGFDSPGLEPGNGSMR